MGSQGHRADDGEDGTEHGERRLFFLPRLHLSSLLLLLLMIYSEHFSEDASGNF